jgi:nitrate reductase beta subunit
LTAGDEEPVARGLERMLAMRAYMRAKTLDGVIDDTIARKVGLSGSQIEDMYQIMAIANYEDRFVIPTVHRELGEDAYDLRGSCGFSFGNGCSDGRTEVGLFGSPKKKAKTPMEVD